MATVRDKVTPWATSVGIVHKVFRVSGDEGDRFLGRALGHRLPN